MANTILSKKLGFLGDFLGIFEDFGGYNAILSF